MYIASKKNSIFIIAEAGVNHNGSIQIAKKLIEHASRCGADAIKFQTFDADELVSVNAKKMSHQAKASKKLSQLELLKRLELSHKDHQILKNYCRKFKIIFMSTAFDLRSLELLKRLKINIFKIPSSELNNLVYLKKIASFKKRVILSTGMGYLSEVKKAINILTTNGLKKKQITLLHCTSQYPAEYKNLNLNAIKTLKKETGCKIGYSDHSRGLIIPYALASHNITVYEKHFTLSRKMKGPDHIFSIEPNELNQMIRNMRNINDAMGDGIKKPNRKELEHRNLGRKSIIAKKIIKKGDKFSKHNITLKRPGTGISPMEFFKLIGKKSNNNYKPDNLIKKIKP